MVHAEIREAISAAVPIDHETIFLSVVVIVWIVDPSANEAIKVAGGNADEFADACW